ncbi:uncharacterized protein LOC133394128 [Anopheles gambiae]|uniref:uncharacterized protein LOC133394128 n=1 Tax=Anopheles gambiae TaxID=7165 RepID=UPI002AC986BA|nr:uncharacterized protein LOC133394128 [Anopheles gambiae]
MIMTQSPDANPVLEIIDELPIPFVVVMWRVFKKYEVPVPDLIEYVIIAPRGAPLTIPEIFLQPLTFASWMLLLVIVVISFLVMWNTGQYFRNDLILLPFCGIERYNLNETRAMEKMIVVGLMVFYFLIQSGYESIIISLISERQQRNKKHTNIEGGIEDGDIVKFGDLAPFWAVIGIGWTLSIVVFMLERFTNLILLHNSDVEV